MFMIVEKRIRGGICQEIHRYARANNKYMNNYVGSIESSFLAYLDANNLYGYPICEKLPVNGFKWVEDLSQFNEGFIKMFDENSNNGYFIEVDLEYPKHLFNSHKVLPYLTKKKRKIGKCKKLISNIKDVVHIRTLKQALNHGLILKEVHRVI